MKNWLKKWLFGDTLSEIEKFQKEKLAFEMTHLRTERGTAALTREILSGYDGKTLFAEAYKHIQLAKPEPETDILNTIPQDEQDSFLTHAKEIKDNPIFLQLISHLVMWQVLMSVGAPTEVEREFGRATINGVSLVREEIERLTVIHTERHKSKPPFDRYAPIS